MIIVIEGMNRTEFCRPKNRDVDKKRFYATRGMLYRAYPNQFTRLRIREYGREIGTEEIIVYPENCIHAYQEQERHVFVSVDKILNDIDENRILTGTPFNKKSWGLLSSKTGLKLWQSFPLILCGLVLLYAFASNGFQF